MSAGLTPYQALGGAEKLRACDPPFAIGENERDLWLVCMRQALRDVQVEAGLSVALANAFYKTADHLRNRPEG
jgi:hemoglobin